MNRRSFASHFTTDRPVAVLMVFTAAVVFGYFSFNRLPVTLMPELQYPTLTVRTEYEGAAPEEVENDVSRPIEEELGVVSGLSRISSISRAGVSDVVLEFNWGVEMSEAAQDTLERLDLVFLPPEVERPLILRFDPSLDPIMELTLSGGGMDFRGEQGLRRLRRIGELQIKRKLEPIEGVAAVRVRGGLEEEIHVALDQEKLLQTGIPVQEVIQRLRQENVNVAGGEVREGRSEYMVRTLNEFQDLNQIANTVVRRIDEREVRISDLGSVEWGHKEREIVTKTDGSESVQIEIYKEADANIVTVARQVRGALNDRASMMRAAQPGERAFGGQVRAQLSSFTEELKESEGVDLRVVADRSIFIKNSIDEVRNSAIIGGILAVIVLFLFLGDVKTTAIIAVSIPMSLLMTFAPMNLMGVSLNIMSLGGLALGVGMLVDSSIVVLESIFRCKEEGDDTKTAAIRGAYEVRGAVVASTLTTVAVFFPMVFVQGIAGQAFGDLGAAVVVSLLCSLLVAVFFIPMLASRKAPRVESADSDTAPGSGLASWRQFRTSIHQPGILKWIAAPYFVLRLILASLLEILAKTLLFIGSLLIRLVMILVWPILRASHAILMAGPIRGAQGTLKRVNGAYPRLLARALHRPGLTVAFLVLALAVIFQTMSSLDSELLPEVHQGEFTFEVSLPVGTPLARTQSVFDQAQAAILEHRNILGAVLVTYGFDSANMKRSDEGEHSARFKILLPEHRRGPEIEREVVALLREKFSEIPDVAVRMVKPVLFSSKTPIVVEVYGDDLVKLRRMSAEARDLLSELPELADVESTLRQGAPEVQVIYDRSKLALYNLNISTVAEMVRNLVKGAEATSFNLQDRRVPIITRLREVDRDNVADIGRLSVNPGGTKPIPLDAVAHLKISEGPSEVRRVDGQRAALIQANIATGSLGSAVDKIRSTLDRMLWPDDMTYLITGQNEEWENSEASLYLALALSLFLVYVIMASQFESLLQPFIILFTVPLAFLGTAFGLWILGMSLSIPVFLGMIMLVGIVVNNAIVLVDYINTLRSRGIPLIEAITTAASVRLRPILLTTATTVLGLIPMALGLGDGAEIRTPMAVAVICGLISSTILTLIVIPVIYALIENSKAKLFRAEQPAPEEKAMVEA